MRNLLFFVILFLLSHFSVAQQAAVPSSEITLNLQKLNTLGSVLYVAAHPDDENTRLLSWLSKEMKVRTAYLSITRGDGGQNLIGKEQGEPLGLIRTQELLAARRIDGAEQFFTRAYDFGFSKNPEETFRIWNKDSVLADMVLIIRKFRPDVIICRFPTTGEGGHGHHTASALLAVEAFDAAADPSRFSYQLSSLKPWQAKRIVWNTFNFGTTNTTSPDQLQVDVGGYNPLLGKSYGEISAASRSMHKSQGFGSAPVRGSQLEYFKHLKGSEAKTSLFENIDISWNRIKGAEGISKAISELLRNYDASEPSRSVTGLIGLYVALEKLKADDETIKYWKNKKLEEVSNLIAQCSGLWFEAYTSDPTLVPGQPAEFSVSVVARNLDKIRLESISWAGTDSSTSLELKKNNLYTFKHRSNLFDDMEFTNPYWLKQERGQGSFIIGNRAMTGYPENMPAFTADFTFNIEGKTLQYQRPVVYRSTDPVKGELYRPVEVVPPATVNLSEKAYVFAGKSAKKIEAIIRAHRAKLEGKINFEIPKGWKATENSFTFKTDGEGEEKVISITLEPDGNTAEGILHVSLTIDGKKYSQAITRIDYDHIPQQIILAEAKAKLVNVELNRTASNIGYIPGAGDDVPQSLRQVGYNVTILNDEQLIASDLSVYDAIVTGVRAYNTNDRLQVHYNKLMKYVENGGNLVVQYNTNNRIGPIVAKISPYPLNISRERVTDENAPVTFSQPDHIVLNAPNKITQEDFKGWIQERGIYFATDISKDYETPLLMNDPNEKPNAGSLLIAKYGKGNFVYTGLVFFRELPAGIPGAYRLFSNLLSLPDNK